MVGSGSEPFVQRLPEGTESGRKHRAMQLRATSNTDAPAKNWSAQIMEAIKTRKGTLID
jgi:hypothetical protein